MTNIPGMGLVEDPFENEVDDAKDPGKAYYKEHTVGAIYIPKISVSLPLFDETNAALFGKRRDDFTRNVLSDRWR